VGVVETGGYMITVAGVNGEVTTFFAADVLCVETTPTLLGGIPNYNSIITLVRGGFKYLIYSSLTVQEVSDLLGER
jgi:hypothetical protein